MKDASDTIIVLAGHTDKHGSNEYNVVLSKNRAESVEMYLIKSGILSNQIVKTEWFGETQLISGATDHQNRRVIILSVDDK